MNQERQEIATLGGGCFWCLEAAYEEISGVVRIVSGYAGGSASNPTYEQVCSGRTGHAEVVQLTYDPDVVSFGDLLDIFFTIHDPTTLNRQGADVGTQYRSVIFYHDETQRETALRTIRELEAAAVWPNGIVTEVSPAPEFFPAEEYHQRYYARNPGQGYCRAVIAPKLSKLRKEHFERLRRSDGSASKAPSSAGGSGGAEGRLDRESPLRDGERNVAGQRQGALGEGQVRPYQGEPKNPMDQGGISD